MSYEEILENNKSLASFMGADIRNGYAHPYEYCDFKDEKGLINETVRVDNLKYNTNWDWIMPVVDKIIEIDITPAPNWTGYRVEIVPRGYVKISGFPMETITTNVSIEGSLINAVWLAVVKFVKLHELKTA